MAVRRARIYREHGVRSQLEKRGKDALEEAGVEYEYEKHTIAYEVPERTRKYTPDFKIGDVFYEFKGAWDVDDRQKHVLIKNQYPDLKLVMVFDKPFNKLNKLSNTSYAGFCDKHGIKWISMKDFLERMEREKIKTLRRKAYRRPGVRTKKQLERELGKIERDYRATQGSKPGTHSISLKVPLKG